MASSDSKPAFRLPWQSGHTSETESDTTRTAVAEPPAWPSHDLARRQGSAPGATATDPAGTAAAEAETAPAEALVGSVDGATGATEAAVATDVTDATVATDAAEEMAEMTSTSAPDAQANATGTGAASVASGPPPAAANPAWTEPVAAGGMVDRRTHKPTKFLADLTRAMRLAADESRQTTLTQFQADVARHVESARFEAEAAAARARRRADHDMAALREWSKAEIARIKQETEDGANRRRERLEAELADQAAGLELELERVQEQVRSFENEMEGFFQPLAQEEDPALFAAMAEQLPEPPVFEKWAPEMTIAMTTPDSLAAAGGSEGEAEGEAEGDTEPETVATGWSDATMTAEPGDAAMTAPPDDIPGATVDTADATDPAGATADTADATEAADAVTIAAADGAPDGTGHGMPPMRDGDFAAAEAEAAADWLSPEPEATAEQDATASPTEGETAGAPWPTAQPAVPAPASGAARTQVAVVGLVSVASIATFKRLLSRAPGIHSVQVASGPDGEFVFSAAHDPDCDVPAAVRSLQGFEVQVVDAGPGVVNAHAVDPEVV